MVTSRKAGLTMSQHCNVEVGSLSIRLPFAAKSVLLPCCCLPCCLIALLPCCLTACLVALLPYCLVALLPYCLHTTVHSMTLRIGFGGNSVSAIRPRTHAIYARSKQQGAMPCHTKPYWPCLTMPCHAIPPYHAVSYRAVPCRAILCRFIPCHFIPCHAARVPHARVPHARVPCARVPCA